MIYKNIELYNVSELCQGRAGMQPLRIPEEVAKKCGEHIINASRAMSGVELRFNLEGDEAEITLCTLAENTSTVACLYHGNIASGWQDVVFRIYSEPTTIKIKKHPNLDTMREIDKVCNNSYDSSLVRLLFPIPGIEIIDIKGKVSPPKAEQTPSLTYLAYGSSITHGSLGILPMNTYAYLTAEALSSQLVNLGVAGSAFMDDAMADFVASRDFSFATLEMGINVINKISTEEYDKRVRNFITKVASSHPRQKIFCIDMVYSEFDLKGDIKAAEFRKALKTAVEELRFDNTVYINGLTLMDSPKGLSADLVHPSVWGCREIAQNLCKIIKKHI